LYVASELAVYYPGEPRFAPDLLAVRDVDTHPRDKWVVSAEGRGLDLVLEVIVAGDRAKDLQGNVTRYASLGVEEYFVYDRGRHRLLGWQQASPGVRSYSPIVPQGGRLHSAVLGLDLVLTPNRLRFRLGDQDLLTPAEIIDRLEAQLEEGAGALEVEALRSQEVEERATEDRRLRAEADARAAEADARAAEADARAAEADARAAEADARAAEDRRLRAEADARAAALQMELERLRRGG
jgi:hypothetical protein